MVLEFTHGFGHLSSLAVARWGFALAAIWWVIFFIPLVRNVRQRHALTTTTRPLRQSWSRVWQTIRHLRQHKYLAWFLIAYFCYIDGVDTIFTMATSIGLDIGITSTTLIMVLLVVQLVAFPCSLFYGWLAAKTSTRTGILVAIVVYLLICLDALRLHTAADFWLLAVLVGTSQGGIQALSRSYFGRIVPKERSSEFFGFYNILGKFSVVLGPILVGVVTQITGQSRIGAASLSILFILGLVIFGTLPHDATDKS